MADLSLLAVVQTVLRLGRYRWVGACMAFALLMRPCTAAEAQEDPFCRGLKYLIAVGADDANGYKTITKAFQELIDKYPDHPLRVQAEYHRLLCKARALWNATDKIRDAELNKDWAEFRQRFKDTKYPVYYYFGLCESIKYAGEHTAERENRLKEIILEVPADLQRPDWESYYPKPVGKEFDYIRSIALETYFEQDKNNIYKMAKSISGVIEWAKQEPKAKELVESLETRLKSMEARIERIGLRVPKDEKYALRFLVRRSQYRMRPGTALADDVSREEYEVHVWQTEDGQLRFKTAEPQFKAPGAVTSKEWIGLEGAYDMGDGTRRAQLTRGDVSREGEPFDVGARRDTVGDEVVRPLFSPPIPSGWCRGELPVEGAEVKMGSGEAKPRKEDDLTRLEGRPMGPWRVLAVGPELKSSFEVFLVCASVDAQVKTAMHGASQDTRDYVTQQVTCDLKRDYLTHLRRTSQRTTWDFARPGEEPPSQMFTTLKEFDVMLIPGPRTLRGSKEQEAAAPSGKAAVAPPGNSAQH